MAGEGTALAVSRESGRGRDNGIENVRANAARDGKDEDVDEPPDIGGDSGGCGATEASFRGGVGAAIGEGVLGGGGWASEVSHASRAASSSKLTRGSNSLRTSFDT